MVKISRKLKTLKTLLRFDFKKLSFRVKSFTLVLAILAANLAWFPATTQAVPANMMVFWDPGFGSVPAGWSLVTTFDGRFPRGESVANYGTTGGASPVTPTVNTITEGLPSNSVPAPGTGAFASSDLHVHGSPSVTVGADSNGTIPAFRSMQLIKYTSGSPYFLPGGAIVMFDTNGAMPGSGFTRISTNDNRIIRVNSTVATGGADTATNSVTIGAMPTATAQFDAKVQATAQTQAISHTHAAPAVGNTTAVSTVPPYVEPVLAQANSNTAVLPAGMIAMFDGDPEGGWQVVSGSGGAYYQQFLRPAATANLTSQGALTHTPPNYVINSGASSGTSPFNTRSNGGGSGVTLQSHVHQLTISFNAASNIPQYFNVVLAQKITFSLQNYRWYSEVASQNVTDPWPTGGLDLAQNTMLPTIPAAYQPPDVGTQLRLRVQVLVGNKALPASTSQFKLQYKKATDGSCSSGSWTDVSSGNAWIPGTNVVTDNTTLTATQLSPASSVLQLFSRSSPTGVNPNAVATGQTMEYDFLISNSSAEGASQYSIRMVESTGQPFFAYSTCPTLVTRPSSAQVMRHGNFYQDGVEAGFEWAD